MVRRFLTFLASIIFVSPLAVAQDSDPEASSTEEYAPQSEIVTVLNEKNEDGVYVAGRSADGYPTMTFRLTVPKDAENFYRFAEYYGEGGAFKNYAYLYSEPKYVKFLQAALKSTVVGVDADKFEWSFSASCDKVSVDEGSAYDYTLILKDYKNLNYAGLRGSSFEISIDTLAAVCQSEVESDGSSVKVKYIYKKYSPATYSFLSDSKTIVEQISSTVKSSELNNIVETMSLYLNSGSMLVVDNDFVCKNVYVEAADESNLGLPAGIVINSGASLIADSVYFMQNFEDEHSVGYIINNGTCSAGFVFMKNAQNTRKLDNAYAFKYNYVFTNSDNLKVLPVDRWYMSFPSFSSPVKQRSGWVDMSYRKKNGSVYTTGLWSPFNESTTKWMGLNNVMQWDDYFASSRDIPFYLMHIYIDSEVLRIEGEINDEDSYALPLTNLAKEGNATQTFVNNPYPAPVDWRSVADEAAEVDGDDSFASDIRDIQYGFYKHSIFSIYNLKTGITTLDVPNKMYYGYIQPNMTNVSLLHQTGNRADVKFAKSNLTTYQEADAKYAGSDYTNGLPYVRLYVDEVVDSLRKGVGRRSVVALYFVPKADFDNLHDGACEDYDPVYDVNTLWESLAETRLKSVYPLSNFGGGQLFPYLGAYGVNQTNGNVAAAIKMVAIPESDDASSSTEQNLDAEEVLNNFIRISIEPRLKTALASVEFGVVDYDLKDSHVGIKVGGLSLNYPKQPDVLQTTIVGAKGYQDATRKGFVSNKKFCEWDCSQISLDLTVAKGAEKQPTSDKPLNNTSVDITAGVGFVSVSSSVAGQLRVYDLLGRLVTERNLLSGKTSVSMPAGYYVVGFSSGDSSTVKSLIVK
ncbi:MAG: T9SS type A sorting domain-containing protein [Marinilabiliaceae bacterium]